MTSPLSAPMCFSPSLLASSSFLNLFATLLEARSPFERADLWGSLSLVHSFYSRLSFFLILLFSCVPPFFAQLSNNSCTTFPPGPVSLRPRQPSSPRLPDFAPPTVISEFPVPKFNFLCFLWSSILPSFLVSFSDDFLL